MSKRCILIMSHNSGSLHKQQGSSIIIALFVIIIISLLGASLASLQRDSAQGTSYEVYAARAYLSAYSASEIALVTLFPLNSTDADTSNCSDSVPTASISVPLSDDAGFSGCTASYQCEILTPTVSQGLPTRYKVVSTAVCQNAQTVTRRQVTVEAVNL